MRYLLFFLSIGGLASCQQQPAKVDNKTMDLAVRTMNDSAKQLLIDLSNAAWFQSQVADVAVRKLQDTSMLSLAQTISKQYLRIKEKAKIVSIPYKLNMPYFLKSDQNARVNELKAMDEVTFGKEFVSQISSTNDLMSKQCADLQAATPGDSDILGLIRFSKSIIENTQMLIQQKK